ncbi:MAG: hypothetical protein ACKO1W_05580 [Microcystaceae cyanobacterium]
MLRYLWLTFRPGQTLKPLLKLSSSLVLGLGIFFSQVFAPPPQAFAQSPKPESLLNLPNLSGLTWLEGGQFLSVHDSKDKQGKKPAISLLTITDKQATWQPLTLNWEKLGAKTDAPSDLESMTRIPRSNYLIAAESGYEQTAQGRLFLLEWKQDALIPIAVINWPKNIRNIEGIAATELQGKTYLLYGERVGKEGTTELCWSTLSLQPFRLGDCNLVRYPSPDPHPQFRAISDLALDDQGNLYQASAYDPDQDNGPFASSVWQVGIFQLGEDGKPTIKPLAKPKPLAEIRGYKVEALTLRQTPKGQQVWIGTDDENFGGTIRLLPDLGLNLSSD